VRGDIRGQRGIVGRAKQLDRAGVERAAMRDVAVGERDDLFRIEFERAPGEVVAVTDQSCAAHVGARDVNRVCCAGAAGLDVQRGQVRIPRGGLGAGRAEVAGQLEDVARAGLNDGGGPCIEPKPWDACLPELPFAGTASLTNGC